jgi:hypothetical protein
MRKIKPIDIARCAVCAEQGETVMRRRPALSLAGALAVVGMVAGPAVAPAGAGQRFAQQTLRVTVYEIYPNGHPEGTGPIRVNGVVDGTGVDQHIASVPSDPPNSIRDVSTFANGSFTVVSTGGMVTAPKVDGDCHISFRIHGLQTDVVSGTGAFAHATGHFTDELKLAGVLPRNSDGSCNRSRNVNPLFDTVRITARGHLQL